MSSLRASVPSPSPSPAADEISSVRHEDGRRRGGLNVRDLDLGPTNACRRRSFRLRNEEERRTDFDDVCEKHDLAETQVNELLKMQIPLLRRSHQNFDLIWDLYTRTSTTKEYTTVEVKILDELWARLQASNILQDFETKFHKIMTSISIYSGVFLRSTSRKDSDASAPRLRSSTTSSTTRRNMKTSRSLREKYGLGRLMTTRRLTQTTVSMTNHDRDFEMGGGEEHLRLLHARLRHFF